MASVPSAIDELAAKVPPDVAGAIAANRLEFQISWAICRVLDLHDSGQSYALVLDYFDDVVELDDEESPTSLDFYQVKTRKSGNWTATLLLKRGKSKKSDIDRPSILGKLTGHRKVFTTVRLTSFISNRPVSLKLGTGKKPCDIEAYCLLDVEEDDRKKIIDAVEEETNITIDDEIAGNLKFVITPLTEDDHENQCKGRFVDWIERHIGSDAPVAPAYKVLRAEIKRRNNHEKIASDAADLRAKKMFGRSHMEQIVERIHAVPRSTATIDAITASLADERFAFKERSALVRACREVIACRLNPEHRMLAEVAELVRESVDAWGNGAAHGSTIREMIAFVENSVDRKAQHTFASTYSSVHFTALSLLVCHEHLQFPSSSTKSEDETA